MGTKGERFQHVERHDAAAVVNGQVEAAVAGKLAPEAARQLVRICLE